MSFLCSLKRKQCEVHAIAAVHRFASKRNLGSSVKKIKKVLHRKEEKKLR